MAFGDGGFLAGGQYTVEATAETKFEFDFITDPTSKDTDGDGIDDYDEIHGYCFVPIEKRGLTEGENAEGCKATDDEGNPLFNQIFRKSDPTNPDSDGDTATDGLERDLGGDPRDPTDRDKFADDDGDGTRQQLPNSMVGRS